MIYLCKTLEGIDNKIFEIIPKKIVLKINQIKDYKQRLASAVGYLLLIEGLRTEYEIFSLPDYGYNEFGKPYLVQYPSIHFNISHSGSMVACVISNSEIGIDLEMIKPHKESLIKYCLSSSEYQSLTANFDEEFIVLWTKKESYLKCLGTGISDDLKNCLHKASNYHFQTTKIDNYILTVCYVNN